MPFNTPWSIVSKPENEFQILESHTRIYVTENGVSQAQIEALDVKPYLVARTDTHDGRTTLVVQSARLPKDAKKMAVLNAEITAYLDTYKGKCLLLCDPAIFDQFSFSKEDPSKRVYVTKPANLKKSQEAKESEFKMEKNPDPSKYFEEILILMSKCGFLPSKIKEYRDKGIEGIRVMFKSSTLQCLFDNKGKLVGLCRHMDLGFTDQGQQIGYLCDTLVDPEAFMSEQEKQEVAYAKLIEIARERGTQELYSQSSDDMHYQWMLLISPPGRVAEFDKNFGTQKPQDNVIPGVAVGYRFGLATPKYQQKLTEHAESLKPAPILKDAPMSSFGNKLSNLWSPSQSRQAQDSERVELSYHKGYTPTN